MKQKIPQKVLVLLMDLLIFTWQVARKIILPARNRKGNVLSSLLTFIVGLLERIVSFEKSILQRPVIFTHKYVKQGLTIAIGFLFLLSSIEWTVAPSADAVGKQSPATVACSPAASPVKTTTSQRIHLVASLPAGRWMTASFLVDDLSLASTGEAITAKRWLRFRVFRI
jgi:hypothetical protein